MSAPDGARWRVARVWSSRPRPRWRRMRIGGEVATEAVVQAGAGDDVLASIAVVVGVFVLAVIIIPLLLFGVELIVLGLLIAAGVLARSLLGRPWLVQAEPLDGGIALRWRVHGLRASRRTIEQVSDALAAGLDPAPEDAEPLGASSHGAVASTPAAPS